MALEWTRGQTLRLDAVTVRRGGVAILRGVSLALEPAHRHVIIGASGSGKSTLIRLLNRLDDPDSGTVCSGRTPLPDLAVVSLRGAVRLVFQSPRPLPGTLADNLDYPFDVRQLPRPPRSRSLATLDRVGLDPAWLDRDVAHLSGGERQRLAIAVALGTSPEILVLDEPTAALDPTSARAIADLLDRCHQDDGLRTVVVTHDRVLAPRFGDRGIRLHAGVTVDEGLILDVLGRAETNG